MSRILETHTFGYERPAKIQISLRIRAAWSESSLSAFLTAKDAKFVQADDKDWSDCEGAQGDLSLCWVHISSGKHAYKVLTPLNPTFIL